MNIPVSKLAEPDGRALHVGEGGVPRSARDPEHVTAPPPAPQTDAAPKDRFAQLALLLAESVAPVAGATSRPPKLARKRAWHGGYFAGMLLVAGLAVLGFAVGRQRAENGLARAGAGQPAPVPPPQPAPAASTSELPIVTPRPRELPTIPFVSIEVEPAHTEIWLDRELAARGALQLAAIHDGMLHELRFTAPQHETKVLFFRDAPPAGRVILNRISEQPRAAPDAEIEAPKKVSRARTVAAEPPSQAKPAADRSPRVELIEVHAPRVQLLD